MNTLENPGFITSTGDRLLEAAKSVSTRDLRPELERFRKAHQAFVALDAKVAARREDQHGTYLDHGEQDAAAEVLIDELAMSLAIDGFPRLSPFQGLSTRTPVALKKLATDQQSAASISLALAVQKNKKASAKSKVIAKKLIAASRALQAAGKKMSTAQNATSNERRNRDLLVREWTKARALLKLKAKFLQESTGEGVHDLLFPVTHKKPRKPVIPNPVEGPAEPTP